MSGKLKPCPFCGSQPKVRVRVYNSHPGLVAHGLVFCPTCKENTNNPVARRGIQVQQSVFWTDEEILKHVGNNMKLYDSEGDFDATTAAATDAAARRMAISMWQQRAAEAAGGGG